MPHMAGDALMSGRHARIWRDGASGELQLTNLGVNCCKVDGQVLKGKDGQGQSAPLREGTTVVICSKCSPTEFRYVVHRQGVFDNAAALGVF
jgi:hypothetical protein